MDAKSVPSNWQLLDNKSVGLRASNNATTSDVRALFAIGWRDSTSEAAEPRVLLKDIDVKKRKGECGKEGKKKTKNKQQTNGFMGSPRSFRRMFSIKSSGLNVGTDELYPVPIPCVPLINTVGTIGT